MKSEAITKADLVRVVSRVIALYLLLCALIDCTYLPQYLHSYLHHRGDRNIFVERDYWTDYYLLDMTFMLMRMLGLALGARLFWRSSPRVAQLLLLSGDDTEKQRDGTAS